MNKIAIFSFNPQSKKELDKVGDRLSLIAEHCEIKNILQTESGGKEKYHTHCTITVWYEEEEK